ncbi:MAG: CBS domain-containing protein [Planctomycetota bacterium]
MRVEHLMTGNPVCIERTTNVSEAAKLMRENDIGLVVVVEDGKPVGVLTDRDVACRVVGAGSDPALTPAEAVMTGNPETVALSASDEGVREAMQASKVRRIIVLDDDGRAVGVVSLADMVQQLDEIGEVLQVVDAVTSPAHG